MRVCVPITADGQVDPRWGRAGRVALADVADGEIRDWQEFTVACGTLHDQGTEGAHHARVARFLRDNQVDAIAVRHVGSGMQRMLDSMAIRVVTGPGGDARRAARAAARPARLRMPGDAMVVSKHLRLSAASTVRNCRLPDVEWILGAVPSLPLITLRNGFERLGCGAPARNRQIGARLLPVLVARFVGLAVQIGRPQGGGAPLQLRLLGRLSDSRPSESDIAAGG